MNTAAVQVESNLLDPLLAALADQLGSPIALDADGQCALLFDPEIEVVIAATAPDEVAAKGPLVTVRSRLAAAGGADPAPRLRRALALNYGVLPPGLVIAVDEASDQIVLLAQMPVSQNGAAEFVTAVATVVQIVPQLRELLAKEAAPAVEARPAADASMARDLGFNSFQGIRG